MDEGNKEINDNTPASLIVSLLHEHATRQGVIYEVYYKIDNIFCREANLPHAVRENLELGQKGEQQGMASLNAFGQKLIEFQKLVCQADKSKIGEKNFQMVKW